MLWKGSTMIGCGWAASCQLLVCHYDPPGTHVCHAPFLDHLLALDLQNVALGNFE